VSLVTNVPNLPDHTVKNFLEAYSRDSLIRERCSPPLQDFLSRINVPVRRWNSAGPWHASPIPFTPFLVAPDPYFFLDMHEHLGLGEDYILLYPTTGRVTGGLFFDMRQNLVCMISSWGRYPGRWPTESCSRSRLEDALAMYLKQYEVGKFLLPEQGNGTDVLVGLGMQNDFLKIYKYEELEDGVQRVTRHDVERTLTAYHSLLAAIVSRVPGAKIHDEPLVDKETLTRWAVGGFAAEFLSRARRPSFKYIAPGITTFDSDSFNSMMEIREKDEDNIELQKYRIGLDFEDEESGADWSEWASLPIFPGDTPVVLEGDGDRSYSSLMGDMSLTWYLTNEISGVYLRPEYNWGDTVKFVLPYSIGQKGHIEGGIMQRQPVCGHTVLYQHGSCPFFGEHSTRLFTLLDVWTENVRSGAFSVGIDGVEGGMELYREADTEHPSIQTDVGICWQD